MEGKVALGSTRLPSESDPQPGGPFTPAALTPGVLDHGNGDGHQRPEEGWFYSHAVPPAPRDSGDAFRETGSHSQGL